MYNFFTDKVLSDGEIFEITGKDYNHIKNVLRLNPSERVLVSNNGVSNLCEIFSFAENSVLLKVIEKNYQDTALPIELYLFQGLPKSDKMELIIQKAVELGVVGIIPVNMERCIAKIEPKKVKSKVERWQAISESAGKQSKRTIIPKVYEPLSLTDAVKMASTMDLFILPYEAKDGMSSTIDAIKKMKAGMKVAVMIGPEGGFSEQEVLVATNSGANVISLGKRILRTETASITALSMFMLYAEMQLN